MQQQIGYLYDKQTDIELVVCNQSSLSYPLHNHISVFTMGIVLNGFIKVTIDKGTRVYQKGETFVVFPYVPHSIQAQTCYTLLSLCINKKAISDETLDSLKSNLTNLLKRTIVGYSVDYNQVVNLLDCLKLFSQPLPTSENSYIDALKRKLETNPEVKLSIDEMAAFSFTSKYNFIRTFKQEVGLTPHQFQIQNRVRKAQRLLNEINSIAEVALTTGFFDQSHFVKHFKKLVGMTPTDYKMSCGVLPLISAD